MIKLIAILNVPFLLAMSMFFCTHVPRAQSLAVDGAANEVPEASLSGVSVAAYGVGRKSAFTGSAAAVTSERLEKISGSGFAEALQGLSAGVNVVNSRGVPGGESRILIRGIGTMGRSADVDAARPLCIVDGVPFDGSLMSIAQSDIESITVLKDAAASSLYGSRAAGGVIVIATKTGKTGKPVINFKASWGTSDFAVGNPAKADPRQHLANIWEGLYNDQVYMHGRSDADARRHASANVLDAILIARTDSKGAMTYVSPFRHISEPYVLESGQVNPNLQLIWNREDYDWYSSMFAYKLRQDYSLDAGGSSKTGRTKYYFSGSWLDDQGYALRHYYKRYSFRANVSSEITGWLEAGANLAYAGSRQNASGYSRALVLTSSMTSPFLRNSDNTDWVRSRKTGSRMYHFGEYSNSFSKNPAAASGDYWNNPDDRDFNNAETGMFSSRFFVQLNLPFDLRFKSNLGVDRNSSTSHRYGSAVHGWGQLEPYGVTVKTTGGWAALSAGRSLSTTWNNLLAFDRRCGKHSVNALLGHELYTLKYDCDYSYGGGIMQIGQYEPTSATNSTANDSFWRRYSILSFFAGADYGYGDRYYLSASYRRDGSSLSREKKGWGDFFSVGASWRISGESFFTDDLRKTLTGLMLRGSCGTSGSDRMIDSDGALAYYGYQSAYGMSGDNAGQRPSTVATWDMKSKYEKNAQFNLALDFSLFSRVNVTAEYYNRRSKDLLHNHAMPVPPESGFPTDENRCDMLNSGIEVTLNANIIRSGDFSWDADFNWTLQHNEITRLSGGEYTFTTRGSTYKIAEGHSRWEFFMPSFAGVDPANGNALYYVKDADGKRITTDDFSKVTLDDYEWQGSALPRGFASLANAFRWKGFDLSFMLYASFGGKMFDYNWLERVTLRGGASVIPELTEDRWRKPGDQAAQPRWSYGSYNMNAPYASNYFLFDNTFVRLRNVTLGYTLPKSLVARAGLASVRLWLSADNLLTFGSAASRYTEPETEVTGNNYNGSELTENGYPGSRRVFAGGIRFSF
ncbi:MAG: SusC/RagA family TonB-linked outer membrane protein [Prevotellaceae bacterium]|jgi:TonB-linked SusC/RagA family outer membrane protein|nr:SusC/RagA family TonB-linked outer membrane protein [Prevotellaceae bacterium]